MIFIFFIFLKVFESTLAVLPTPVFIKVVKQLLSLHQPANIQRKALEVLNARFSQNDLNDHNLPAILQALAGLAISEPQDTTNKNAKGIPTIFGFCVKNRDKYIFLR